MSGPVVIGTVVSYDPDTKTGYALVEFSDIGEVRVKFHGVNYRKVIGTPEEPTLTHKQQSPRYVDPTDPTLARVIMEVVATDKGFRVKRWGRIPRRSWIRDKINQGGLQQYVGGTLSIYENGELSRASLQEVKLAPLTITVKYQRPYKDYWITETREFKLNGAQAELFLPCGRFAVAIVNGPSLTFHLPDDQLFSPPPPKG